jgi:hypothetical protein
MMKAPARRMIAMVVATVAFLATDAASAQQPATMPAVSGTPVQIFPATIYPLTPEREQSLRPKDSFKECDICPEMVVVPKGSFTMGTPTSEPDRDVGEDPLHRVNIPRPFAVARFKISFDDWDACVADNGCDGIRGDDNGFGRGRLPAYGISFEAAKSYLAWISRKVGRTIVCRANQNGNISPAPAPRRRSGLAKPSPRSKPTILHRPPTPTGRGAKTAKVRSRSMLICRTNSGSIRFMATAGSGRRTTPRIRQRTALRGSRATAPNAWCAAARGIGRRTCCARVIATAFTQVPDMDSVSSGH